MKVCSRCKKRQSPYNFRPSRKSGDGLYSWCKDCDREYHKKYHREHKSPERLDYLTNWRLQEKFNLTLEEYERMFEEQKGVCAICSNPPKNNRLHVDHDHDTGKIRGLLCAPCNSFLGRINEDTSKVDSYLNKTREESNV